METDDEGIRLPKSVLASVHRALQSAKNRRDAHDRKIKEFESLLRQFTPQEDEEETAEPEAAE